jgi:hypothetical protein
VSVDFGDRFEVVLIAPDRLHQHQIVLLRHEDLQPRQIRQDSLQARLELERSVGYGALLKRHIEPRHRAGRLRRGGESRLHRGPGVDVVGGPPDAIVKGGRRSADHDDRDGLGEGGVDCLEEPLELVPEEGPHHGQANFSNIDRKLSTPMFMR